MGCRVLPEKAFVDVAHRLESQDSEDNSARVKRRERVACTDENNVADAIVVRCVVTSECYQRTEGQTEAVEDLCRGV